MTLLYGVQELRKSYGVIFSIVSPNKFNFSLLCIVSAFNSM